MQITYGYPRRVRSRSKGLTILTDVRDHHDEQEDETEEVIDDGHNTVGRAFPGGIRQLARQLKNQRNRCIQTSGRPDDGGVEQNCGIKQVSFFLSFFPRDKLTLEQRIGCVHASGRPYDGGVEQNCGIKQVCVFCFVFPVTINTKIRATAAFRQVVVE